MINNVGDVVAKGEPLLELHSESATQLEFVRSYVMADSDILQFGF